MDFFGAAIKTLLEKMNDMIYSRTTKKAKLDAFKATGKTIANAKKRGNRVNGKATFRREYRKRTKTAKELHDTMNTFFGHL